MKDYLESIYKKYNKREFVHPDPLEFLYNYEDKRDIEIAGLIASSLAYGRVSQILKSVSAILSKMGESPFAFLMRNPPAKMASAFKSFKHRFTSGRDIADMLISSKKIIKERGSFEDCFRRHLSKEDENILPALSGFVRELDLKNPFLLPDPKAGSACKRLCLFLRWMVRFDDVDLGIWKNIPPSKLIVPLDTHMHKIGSMFGYTYRKAADIRSAMEITNSFRRFSPKDPVRYDFSLTRFGIRSELDIKTLISAQRSGSRR